MQSLTQLAPFPMKSTKGKLHKYLVQVFKDASERANQQSPTSCRIAKKRSEAPDRHSVTKRPQIPLERLEIMGCLDWGSTFVSGNRQPLRLLQELILEYEPTPPAHPVSGSARRYPRPGHARGTACASETMITGGGRIPGQPNLTTRLHVQESSVTCVAPVHRAAMVPRRGVQR